MYFMHKWKLWIWFYVLIIKFEIYIGMSSCCVVANVLKCDIVVNELER